MPKNRIKQPKRPVRSRPFSIRVMANAAEKRKLEKAAKKARRPLTRMVLELALAEIERGRP